ncbi:hypothetical protein Pla52n_02730 [Stieleria varia]|uniref:Uncharacterized protein n=2 Tax=Stieleria varia TaxID=2528005 RepID=A0A5C6B719_9BACT|nr:hypothetical protein Pla52n_02730 [Stieleria varia]
MIYLLTLIVAASRFLPHPPNVACLGALGLFAGCYVAGKRAYLIPLAALLVSDIIGHVAGIPGMGFYNLVTMFAVYAGMLLTVPLGRCLASGNRWARVPAGSLAASTVFFLLSNFGVWLGPWYPSTLAGLAACFGNAIPFFGYTLVGDAFFVALMFGAYEASRVRAFRFATA